MKKYELLKMLEEIKEKFDGKIRESDKSILRVKIIEKRNGYFLRIEGIKTKEMGERHDCIIHYSHINGARLYTILTEEQNKSRLEKYLASQDLAQNNN